MVYSNHRPTHTAPPANFKRDTTLLPSDARLATRPVRRGKDIVDIADRRTEPTFRNLPGRVMTTVTERGNLRSGFIGAVALLRDLPQHGLIRGQVGTVVEAFDETTALVEFSDDGGVAYAIVPCPRDALLVLRTAPLAA